MPEPDWLAVPVRNALDYIEEITRVHYLSVRGTAELAHVDDLLDALAGSTAEERRPSAEEIELGKQMASFARQERDRGFPLLHAHASVAIWGALEALVSEVFIRWIQDVPGAGSSEALAKIRIPLARFHSLDSEQRAALILYEWSLATRAEMGPGVSGFETILSPITGPPPADAERTRTLIELKEVRNLVAHRRGRVDSRFLERCPWLQHIAGEVLTVTDRDFVRYRAAVLSYMASLVRQITGRSPRTSGDASATAT